MFKSPLPDVMVHPVSAAVPSLKALTQTFQYNAHDSWFLTGPFPPLWPTKRQAARCATVGHKGPFQWGSCFLSRFDFVWQL